MAVEEIESPVSKSLFAEILLGQCEFAAGSGQFMTGDVTISGLRAASVHPAKVIVLLGMNDGAFPQAQRSPGPEVADADTRTKASILAKEATSMHAFLLALLAAQRRVIVTFDGYVGASGKRAAAALPVELLRDSCQQLVPDFRIKIHGLTSFQPPVDPEVGKEQMGGPTYDLLATHLPGLLKGETPVPVLKPSRHFSMDMPIDDFIAFCKDPSAFALKQLSVKVPRKNDSIDSDEPLDTGAAVKYEAINWVEKAKRDHREDLSKVTWSEAKLSGRFPPGNAGKAFFDEIITQQVGGLTGIHERIMIIAEVASMSELFEVPGVSKTDFKPYLYPSGNPTKLIVQLNREMDKDEESLFRSLAMWAYLYQTYPGLDEITVVGLPKIEVTPAGKGGDKTSMALRIRLNEIGRAELAAGFAELMGLALDGDNPAYMKLAAKAFMKRRPNNEEESYKPAKLEQNDVTGKFGVIKNSAAKLLLPEVFKLDSLSGLIERMVVEGGMTRFTDKFIPPLKIKKSDDKKSQPKASKTKVQPAEVPDVAPESAPKTKTVRSRNPKPPKSA
jgi:hypothetical protein